MVPTVVTQSISVYSMYIRNNRARIKKKKKRRKKLERSSCARDQFDISKSKCANAPVIVPPRIMRTFVATKWWFSWSSLISSPYPNYRVVPTAGGDSALSIICKCASAWSHTSLVSTSSRPTLSYVIFHWTFHGEIIDRATKREYRLRSFSL